MIFAALGLVEVDDESRWIGVQAVLFGLLSAMLLLCFAPNATQAARGSVVAKVAPLQLQGLLSSQNITMPVPLRDEGHGEGQGEGQGESHGETNTDRFLFRVGLYS